MNTPHLDDLHRAANARLAGDPPRPLTFGDAPAEYAAARTGAALFDRTDRGWVHVEGEEAAAFLHRLLANTVRTLAPGGGNRNLLLSSKGKVLYDFDLAVGEDGLDLSTSPGTAAGLIAALDMYHFSEKVAFEDRSQRVAPLELVGPHADAIAASVLAGELPAGDHAWSEARFEGASVRVVRLDVAGRRGLRLDAGPEHAAELWRALTGAGARPAGRVVHDSLRAEVCAAEFGVDVDDTIYPQEARLEQAVSLDKGCYIGQEVVAKIDTYGGLNKRLCTLAVDHDDPVATGTRLWREDGGEWRDLGVVTTWAYSFARDGGVVLAYIKRRHQDPGTHFRIGDGPAVAQVLEVPVEST
ncbi:MAG TPA: glycine cleavage T C-terminal barrel domain-containing protein [Planctomycetota bacterium]|nr:glycine cleavage T C-terminal barrel domain-containing protein [Planctomycetota bacterium]